MFFPVITPFVVDFFFFSAADSCERVFMAVERCILNRFKVNYSACVHHNKGTCHTRRVPLVISGATGQNLT